MSAELLPTPTGSAAPSRRAEGLGPGRHGVARRPVLSLVAAPARAKRAPFVALLLGILLAGLVGLLLLNTASAQDAFRLHRLQASAANAADARQALAQQVDNLTDPADLAMQAQHLGMVPMGAPEFWKPGTPLPPGARVVDGMVILGAAGPKPAPTAPPSAPPDAASVTSVPRPGQQPSTSTAPSASGQPSTAGRPSAKPTAQAPKAATKPGSTKPGSAKAGATKPTATQPTAARPATAAKAKPATNATGGTGSSR